LLLIFDFLLCVDFSLGFLDNCRGTLFYLPCGCDQVGSVLLSCAFLYDIFWVFISKRWFHESVMIVVSIVKGHSNIWRG
jgi:hypothetical protein